MTFEECSLNTRPIDSWDASLVSWIRRISVASSLSPELRLSCTRLNERLHHQHVGFVIIWLQAFKSHERLTMPRWCCAFLVSRTYAVCTNCRYRRTERHAFIVTLTTKTYLSTCGKREHYRIDGKNSVHYPVLSHPDRRRTVVKRLSAVKRNPTLWQVSPCIFYSFRFCTKCPSG